MNSVLAYELDQAFAINAARAKLGSEDPLRIAAALLSHARDGEITATTVVGVLGHDDVAAFHALVMSISDEFTLEADARLNMGSYSVRFRRPVDANSSTIYRLSTSGPRLEHIMVTDSLGGRVLRFLERHLCPRGGHTQVD
jgi:hypothetical protein